MAGLAVDVRIIKHGVLIAMSDMLAKANDIF